MNRRSWFALCLMVMAAGPSRAQDAPPPGPFKAVHLVNLKSPDDVAALQAAIADMNKVVARMAQSSIRYRLYKVAGKQAGTYAYMWESSWPSGDVYEKVHKSTEWTSAMTKHPKMEAILKEEVYNRYVEVTPATK